MKATIESTSKIVELNGVPARIWEGKTESGIEIHCYITRIVKADDEIGDEEFSKELQWCKPPSPEVEAIPSKLIL
jgi:hypothetical protein